MLALPEVVKNVAIDPSLSGNDVRVYLVASQFLTHDAFRSVKLIAIARPLGYSRASVHRSLRRLCEQEYLERGPRTGAVGPVTYRLTPRLIAASAALHR